MSNWIHDDEYPDDDDLEQFGYDSPRDDDPLTIGYVGEARPRFWTVSRIILAIMVAALVATLVLPFLLR